MNNSIEQLQNYRDKCFIYNILCERSSEYCSHLKSIVNIPLIISSSIMTILNSGSFDAESMKVPNIVINAMTVLLMSLINNFKVVEKCSNFKALTLKYQQLLHYIEDKLANDKNIDGEDVREIVKEEEDYKQFFKAALDKTGKNITDMSDDEKKKFFNAVDNAYTAKNERKLSEGCARKKTVAR